MPIDTPTLLTSGASTTDGTSFVTSSITPAANKLILLFVAGTNNGSPATPTASGNGLTYTQVATTTWDNARASLTLFEAIGASPSSGAITISFGAQSQNSCAWDVIEVGGNINTTDPVAQSATNTANGVNNLTVTLGAFSGSDNITLGAFVISGGTGWTPGTGFTELSDHNVSVDAIGMCTEYQMANDTSVNATHVETNNIGGIAVEVAAPPTAGKAGSQMSLLGVG